MRNYTIILIITVSLIFSSCATIMNEETTTVYLRSNSNTAIIYEGDTIPFLAEKIALSVHRKNEGLRLEVINDTASYEVHIKPKESDVYYGNWFTNLGLGTLVDRDKNKRYAYPTRIWLESAKKNEYETKLRKQYSAGELLMNISFPWINNFNVTPGIYGKKTSTGFLGLSTGMDYYYQKNKYLNLNIGACMDFSVIVPVPVCYESDHESLSSVWGSMTNNHHIGRFSFGYGLSFMRFSWNFIKEEYENENTSITASGEDLLNKSVHYQSHSLGLCFPTNLRILPGFSIGMFYQPSLFVLGKSGGFQYEHLISFEVSWKIRLRKPRSN